MEFETLDYYEKNAEDFSRTTLYVDFSETQQSFLKYMPEGAHVLDFGCGAGRDTKCFLEQGYQVTAIDGSEALCQLASKYTGIPVQQMLFQELNDVGKYDGIWACASILHLKKSELPDVFLKMTNALKEQGVIYTSFKYGTYEGMRNGRYFTNFVENSFVDFIKDIPGLNLEKIWITEDVRVGRGNERWLNILLRKANIS
jgi:cyclopropane fatty-acyl-phospholipid synthase-like methyltransferase